MYLLWALFRRDHGTDFVPQLLEEILLVFKDVAVASRSVAGTDDAGTELARGIQGSDPLLDISMGDEIVRGRHARIPGEQGALIGQRGKRVAMRVSDSEMMQFDPVFAVVED